MRDLREWSNEPGEFQRNIWASAILEAPLDDLRMISELPLMNFFLECEFDADLNLIKGGGGALLREKIIANAASTFIVIADSSKGAEKLGAFPLPIEILTFGAEMTSKKIAELGCEPKLRLNGNQPFITDNGNYILDCDFKLIESPEELEWQLNMILGIIENGLFVNMANRLITIENGVLVQKTT